MSEFAKFYPGCQRHSLARTAASQQSRQQPAGGRPEGPPGRDVPSDQLHHPGHHQGEVRGGLQDMWLHRHGENHIGHIE